MRFDFATATRILFGPGMAREVPAVAASMGTRALVVTGASPGRAAPLIADLNDSGVACVHLSVPGEPTVELIRSGAGYARNQQCDLRPVTAHTMNQRERRIYAPEIDNAR
jgi:alcohol dehydrogenase class IV